MTGAREALRLALRDLYANSWRLVPVNALLGLVLACAAAAALAYHALVVFFAIAGPVAVALVHSAVTLTRTGNLELRDAVRGLRILWRRGLVLGVSATAFAALAVVALGFYGRSHAAWPLTFVTFYLVVVLGIYQLVAWTLAVAEPERRLRDAYVRALELCIRRPGATLALGLALLLVNGAGVAAGVMPFLTVTLAYSSLAAAHFVLPRPEGGN
jgi:hypothetical protein